MGTSLQVARRALARLGDRGKTTAIPGEVRQVLVAYALGQRERGKSWAAIAEALGVSSSGLIRWSRQRVARCEGAVPVEVRLEEPSDDAAVTLVSPAGYRVEELEVRISLMVNSCFAAAIRRYTRLSFDDRAASLRCLTPGVELRKGARSCGSGRFLGG